jgi:exonuclease SbcC
MNQEKEKLDETLSSLLSGEKLIFFEDKEIQLKKYQQDIQKLQEKAKQIVDLDEKCKIFSTQLKQIEENLSKGLKERTDLEIENDDKEKEIRNLEKSKELEEAIKNLEERRQELVKNAPCPLCGSTHHPWAAHAPKITITEDQIINVKNQLNNIQKKLQTTISNISKYVTQKKHNEKEHIEQVAIREKLNVEFKQLSDITDSDILPDQWKSLETTLVTTTKELAQTTAILQEIRTIKDRLVDLVKSIIEETKSHGTCQITCEKAEHEKTSFEKEAERLRHEKEEQDTIYQKEITGLNMILAPYNEKIIASINTNTLIASLKNRLDSFQEQTKHLENLAKTIIPLKDELTGIKTTLTHETRQQKSEIKRVQELEKTLSILILNRRKLFGEKDPQTEQEEIKQKTICFEEELKSLNSELSTKKQNLAGKKETLKENLSDFEKIQKELLGSMNLFQTKLKEIEFSDEEEFLEATLSEEEQTKIQNQKQSLEKRKIENLSLQKNSQKKLDKLLLDPMAHNDMTSTLEKLDDAEKQKSLFTEERGKIIAILEDNEKRVKEHRQKVDDANLQAKESRRWRALNDLIGSADGAKFRKFAQGLTLETLMDKANTYLDMLSRRYVLKRSSSSDLTIEVIDTYYGDHVRLTDNLSGGESFLVSLALALGLSDLSSQRTAVESLFLDEGFGTLDADTLETALAALDTLNASGKTIGIISHVEALKERISAKIEVRPLSGGISELVVTGS